MMNILTLVLALWGTYLLINQLIDDYFDRKEQFVDYLNDRIEEHD